MHLCPWVLYNEGMSPALLIATKLHIPAAHADLIPRPQLFRLLEEGLQAPLTLVSAPAGFGKSMLMAGWLHSRPDQELRIAWLSLDESDNEQGIFWRYFISALQNAAGKIGETALSMLSANNGPGIQTVLATLLNELALMDAPVLLVLDDYHLIKAPEIHENLKFFLDHQPAGVHIAILTREDPALGLARRRARRQLVEIRAAGLRFDASEAAEFLNQSHKLSLTSEQIQTLEQRTEGWITGLQMAALSLQGRDTAQFFEAFTGDDRYVAEYLVEEVLQRQPEPVRSFLLKTSILENLSAGLCSALIGDNSGRENLDYLERANLFLVPLDNHRQWYRYHHLFAELLRQRLRESQPAESLANLQRAACDWYEAQADIPAAIRHARQIPDEARARRILTENAATFFGSGALPKLFELANAIPAAQRESEPRLCAAVAWAALATNHYEAVEDWLKAIERSLGLPALAAIQDPNLEPARRAALLEVLIIRLQLPKTPQSAEHILAIRDQLNALPASQACLFNDVASLKPVLSYNLGLLAENSADTTLAASAFNDSLSLSREQANWHLYHLGRSHFAGLQIVMGHLQAARRIYEQGLAENASLSASPYLSLLHAGLGGLYYEWNDLETAGQHFNQGLAFARLWNQWESLVPITLGLAHIQQRAGQLQAALNILEELKTPPLENLVFSVEAYKALLQALLGNQSDPSDWLAARLAAAPLEPAPANEASLLDLARLMAALRQPKEAIALLEKISAYARNSHRNFPLLRARLALSKVLAGEGRPSEALACLLETLSLAAPEGYISAFIDEGESMRQLLQEARGKLPGGGLRAYVEQLLAAFAPGETPGIERERGALELSERELEILALVAAGLSNQQIADQLVISITTVKTHMGNIFHKLGVSSRLQAIARAEGLGLLLRH